ncbi:Beta-lactamase precursor [Streptomyces sp. YIM 130001]|uniref:class A beta-lactamase n=1 Tax=Streptomyces sp. YIM 130001 TaxID=2259644 RepID=UPI000E6470BA|nr:class A beta-lactamase [Streptomyces sp. YIM 130001]RII09235.1 Beta-lactamase precursor [Streptomyces sp. YIM 130001]
MKQNGPHPSRRTALVAGAGAGTAFVTALAGSGTASASAAPAGELGRQLGELEERYAARLGVFARNMATGRTVRHRADERFPMCSVFKTLAAAAVLRDLDDSHLGRRIHYTQGDVDKSGYAPVTGKPENIAGGLTVRELCAAAVSESDNAAANLLLRDLGGPRAITRFCRSLGDGVTRLDRWEPELNSAEPWRRTDTTSPRAVGTTYARLILGRALDVPDRAKLTGWLVANTTNMERFRAGLPDDWILADKTGGGEQYGVANDVGVVHPPHGAPLVLSVLSTKLDPAGPTDNPLVAEAARLVAAHLVPGT